MSELIILGSIVYNREEVITPTQTAIVETFHDYVTHIRLSSDKQTILPNGIDKAVVTAKLYNYEGLYQVGSNQSVTFSIDGAEQTMSLIDGQAYVEITSDVVGELVIRCDAPSVRGGEVVIHAE